MLDGLDRSLNLLCIIQKFLNRNHIANDHLQFDVNSTKLIIYILLWFVDFDCGLFHGILTVYSHNKQILQPMIEVPISQSLFIIKSLRYLGDCIQGTLYLLH